MRRTEDRWVKHLGQLNVVDIAAVSSDESHIRASTERLADIGRGLGFISHHGLLSSPTLVAKQSLSVDRFYMMSIVLHGPVNQPVKGLQRNPHRRLAPLYLRARLAPSDSTNSNRSFRLSRDALRMASDCFGSAMPRASDTAPTISAGAELANISGSGRPSADSSLATLAVKPATPAANC